MLIDSFLFPTGAHLQRVLLPGRSGEGDGGPPQRDDGQGEGLHPRTADRVHREHRPPRLQAGHSVTAQRKPFLYQSSISLVNQATKPPTLYFPVPAALITRHSKWSDGYWSRLDIQPSAPRRSDFERLFALTWRILTTMFPEVTDTLTAVETNRVFWERMRDVYKRRYSNSTSSLDMFEDESLEQEVLALSCDSDDAPLA
ncbi:hypothetical protein AVEN_244011-1 [Araneus ventricosus]|uniref:Uncharacterized protein n=1 Tax=Araneus ventricosus TaxID=182803 RepID=A0A4Y2I3V6_ARAVE|nr:hypothetical protein AVEN_244011-1 [Araneus ventricosus]